MVCTPLGIAVTMELLGHNSLKTTEIYTHITDKMKKDVISTLDHFDISEYCLHLYEKYTQVCVYTIVGGNFTKQNVEHKKV